MTYEYYFTTQDSWSYDKKLLLSVDWQLNVNNDSEDPKYQLQLQENGVGNKKK